MISIIEREASLRSGGGGSWGSHGRCYMAIHPRVATMFGRSTPSFHLLGGGRGLGQPAKPTKDTTGTSGIGHICRFRSARRRHVSRPGLGSQLCVVNPDLLSHLCVTLDSRRPPSISTTRRTHAPFFNVCRRPCGSCLVRV